MDADDRLLPGGIATLRDAYLSGGRRPDMVSMGMYTVDRYYAPARFEHINDHRTLFEGTFLDFGRQFSFGWSSMSRIVHPHGHVAPAALRHPHVALTGICRRPFPLGRCIRAV